MYRTKKQVLEEKETTVQVPVSPITLPPPAQDHTPGYWYARTVKKPKPRYLEKLTS